MHGPGRSVRDGLLEAAYACVARYGIGKTTMDDVAREARRSRATVYRYFPGGKDQLIREVIAWEASRFFERLAAAVAAAPDFAALLEDALVFAHQAVADHVVLQKILETEPELLLPQLTVQSERILVLIKGFLAPQLSRVTLRDGLAIDDAADFVARMLLSFIGAQGQWDLTDRRGVRRIVASLLAGIT
jgi:AcrR family transcriptional regulator